MYVRSLSTRDIEETFIDAEIVKLLSKGTVSNINERLQENMKISVNKVCRNLM